MRKATVSMELPQKLKQLRVYVYIHVYTIILTGCSPVYPFVQHASKPFSDRLVAT